MSVESLHSKVKRGNKGKDYLRELRLLSGGQEGRVEVPFVGFWRRGAGFGLVLKRAS